MLDFRNVNTLWSSILVATLVKLGLKTAVICPGSRSSPLAVALAHNCEVEAIPILDERSAAFFALGKAKQTNLPIVLVCTSGTAGANFYPAVIEAKESGIPLIILTADRPQELRNCHAGQTIDQVKLYGNYPNWYAELAIPEANMGMLCYLRQNIIQAWEKSLWPIPGVVHLNLPFREPLAPIAQPDVQALQLDFPIADFFAHLAVANSYQANSITYQMPNFTSNKGIIIAGLAQPKDPETYCKEIALLTAKLNFPVLAEALSPLRNYAALNQHLIVTYDLILRNKNIAKQLEPEVIIQLGELPTSKVLRNWLEQFNGSRYVIEPSPENFDPLHGNTIHLRSSISDFYHSLNLTSDPAVRPSENPARGTLAFGDPQSLSSKGENGHLEVSSVEQVLQDSWSLSSNGENPSISSHQDRNALPTHWLGNVAQDHERESLTSNNKINHPYLQQWLNLDLQGRNAIADKMESLNILYEGKVSWLLSQHLPSHTPVFIANSMSVRYAEFFWQPNNSRIMPYFSRGANGIDGTLSTALGIAYNNQSTVLLTGDLALLHDTNGFLIRNKFQGHLTIIVINNNGGGIFDMLPIATFNPPFEEYFATPQEVKLSQLCMTYRIEHKLIDNWQQLVHLLNPLPTTGIRVLEVPTNRKADAYWLQANLWEIAQNFNLGNR